MFIDASAIVAILGRETGSEELEKRLGAAEARTSVGGAFSFRFRVRPVFRFA